MERAESQIPKSSLFTVVLQESKCEEQKSELGCWPRNKIKVIDLRDYKMIIGEI